MTTTPEEEVPARLSIYNLMQMMMDEVNATYAEAGVELPSKQCFDSYGAGQTPHDCEQVSISFEQMYNGLPGAPEQVPGKCYSPRTGVFVIEVTRCVPTLEKNRAGKLALPSVAKLDEMAKQQSADAWLLMDAGLRAAEAANYLGGLSDVAFTPESGGYQSAVLNLVLGIP